MSEKTKSRSDRNELIFRFERDFPAEYSALRAVFKKTLGSDKLADDEDFRHDLGEIVYAYGRGHPRQEYRKAADQLFDDLLILIDKLNDVLHATRELDGPYKERIVEFMASNPVSNGSGYNYGQVLRDFETAEFASSFLRLALGFAFFFETKPIGRSRPRLPYYVPTAQLMHIWKQHARRDVVAPRGFASGKGESEEAIQPFTEFVRLGLKMIDPKISVANTMTLIKRVLKDQKEYGGIPFLQLIAMPEPQELEKALEKFKQQTQEN